MAWLFVREASRIGARQAALMPMVDPNHEEDAVARGWRTLLPSIRGWLANDDILTGFEREESSAPEIRSFFVSTMGAALVAWDVAFNLGAFHTVFFARRHQVAVALFVVVLGAIVLRRQIHVHWWLLVLLSLPMAWILFRLVVPSRETGSVAGTIDGALFVVVVVLFPVVIWIVLRLVAPRYFAIPNLRLKIMSIVIVVLIAALAYGVGEHNGRFLSCNEFAVSGNDLPADCR